MVKDELQRNCSRTKASTFLNRRVSEQCHQFFYAKGDFGDEMLVVIYMIIFSIHGFLTYLAPFLKGNITNSDLFL